ncbi:MAG: taurine dioxygenase [Betaproteobacteria bacterium]|nr:taurine dioxygenase [Betaproteobacteria bacterium]
MGVCVIYTVSLYYSNTPFSGSPMPGHPPPLGAPYMTRENPLKVTPLAYALGATVHGLDMSRPLTPGVIQQIREAWHAHLVLFFPKLNLTDEQQVELGSQFGDLAAISQKDDDSRSYLKRRGKMLVLDEVQGGVRNNKAVWHSDVSFTEQPPIGSLATLRVCPSRGGDTMWSNQYEAYETLSPAIQAMIEGLQAEHGTPLTGKAVHPVVLRHPVTGRRALFVNRLFTSRIVGFTTLESEGILDMLFAHMEQPQFSYPLAMERRRRGALG